MSRYTFLGTSEVIITDPACKVLAPAEDQLPAHVRPGDVVDSPTNPCEALFMPVEPDPPKAKSNARTESEESSA